MTNQEIINFILKVYSWFFHVLDPSISLHKRDIQQYFSPHFVLEINDQIITKGYESLIITLQKYREQRIIMHVDLPFQEVMVSEDKTQCVARFNLIKQFPNNTSQQHKVIAIFGISHDKRLSKISQVVYYGDFSLSEALFS